MWNQYCGSISTGDVLRASGWALLLLPIFWWSASPAGAQASFAGTQYSVGGGSLASPSSIAVDGKGNLFIADTANNRVLQVVPSSTGNATPTVVLGTQSAGLSAPAGLATDWNGNLYVADTGNNRVLMLPVAAGAFGAAVTIGTGLSGPTGLAVDSVNNLYVSDTGNNRIVEFPRVGTGFGALQVIATGFNAPAGLAVDALRSLYVADAGNNRIVKIPFTLGAFAAPASLFRNLSSPLGVAVDSSYNVYIADTGNHRVVEEPWAAGAKRFATYTLLGSDFVSPGAIAVDSSGNVFLADTAQSQVMEIVSSGVNFSAVEVSTPAETLAYDFNLAAGTTLGQVSIAMQGVSGKDFTDAGGSTCVPQTYAVASVCAVNVAFTPQGTGVRQGAVVLLDSLGNALATAFISGSGLAPQAAFIPGSVASIGTQLSGPSGVAVDGNGNVYIADTGNNRVVELPLNGAAYGPQTTLPVTGLNTPMGLFIDGAGNFYIVSNGNDKVIKFPWTGAGFGAQSRVGFGLYGPSNVAVDRTGNVYIADTLDNQLYKLGWTGSAYTQAQSLGNSRKIPVGVAVDPSGDVFFAMPYQNVVLEVPISGGQYQNQIKLPLKGVSFPTALAVDGNSNLYILDTGNNRVLMLPWTGSAFGAQVTVASGFNGPAGMTLDSNGALYVADTGNNQVDKIDLSHPGSLTFANTYVGSTSTDSAQAAVVANTGNLPLAITEVTYPADFPEDPGASEPCTANATITPGALCELAVDFTPATVGSPLTETVTVTEGSTPATQAQQALVVQGTSLGMLTQTISFPAIANIPYGAAAPVLSANASSGLPVTFQILSGPATLTHRGTQLSLTGAGLVVLQVTQPGNGAYSAAAPVTQSFSVLPAVLTVTPQAATAVYGDAPAAFNYTLSGFVLGQSSAQAVTGRPLILSNCGGTCQAGVYTLTATQGTLSAANYSFAFASATLTVSKASLVVAANSTSIRYGASPSPLSWSMSGWIPGDTASSVSGAPSLSVSGGTRPAVGKYTVTPSLGSLASANYAFVFSSGTLTVVPAVLTVTAGAGTMVYGSEVPQPSYFVTGFAAGDTAANTIHGLPQFTSIAGSHPGVGTYSIVASAGSLSAANYTFAFMPGSLVVTPAVLTVTAADCAMTYGSKLPLFTYSISGWVNGDTQSQVLHGTPSLATTATLASHPGTFDITVAAGTLSAKNYTFRFAPAKLTIGKAVLTVKPSALSMTYGARLPAIPYTVSGYLNGDTSQAISGKPSFTAQATSTSPVGTYPISGAVGTLASGSYTFAVQGGTLTVGRALLIVKAATQTMTYGGTLPAFLYSISGFLNGDGHSLVSGTPSFKTTVSSTSAVGSYSVLPGIGTLAAQNYSFAFTAGTMTVGKAMLTVSAANQTMTYGGAVPVLTYSIAGFLNGDTAGKSITGAPQLTSKASATANAGQYGINIALGTLASANYTFQSVPAHIVINKAVLTVATGSQTMTYGKAPATMSYTISGFVQGDTQAKALSGKPKIATAASSKSPVGSYAILAGQGSLSAANYSFQYSPGTLTVVPAVLTVSAVSQTMIYGAAIPVLTSTINGFVNGDTQASAVTGAAQWTTAASSTAGVGVYAINGSTGTLAASNYTFQFEPGAMTITPAPLVVAANNLSMQSGAAVPALTYNLSGLMNGDTQTSATVGVPDLSTAATSASAAGSYSITVAAGQMTAANYKLTFANGTLTVTQ